MINRSSYALLILFLATLACSFPSRTPAGIPTDQPGPAASITRELNIVRKGGSVEGLVELIGTDSLLDDDVVQVTGGGEAILDFGDLLRMRLFNDTQLNAVKVASAAGSPLDVRLFLEAGGFTGTLAQGGGRAEYQTPGGARILVLGTEFFVVYDPVSGITSVGNFQGTLGVDAGGISRAVPNGYFVEVPVGGQPGPERPIRFTLQEFDGRARALGSPIVALQDLGAEPTPTATLETPRLSTTASPTSTLTPTLIPTSTETPIPSPTPTETPTFTQTIPPPPQYVCTDWSSFILPQTYLVDLDSGKVGGVGGADLWFEAVTSTELYLTPVNGAKLAFAGFSYIGPEACADAQLSEDRLDLTKLAGGTHFCMLTTEGRYAELMLTGWTAGRSTVTFSYQTCQRQ
jgi:hypothetical protein